MPKKHSLSHVALAEFPRALSRRYHGSYFSLAVAHAVGYPRMRAACVVSKKVSASAVVRNRVKRRCRAALSPLIHDAKEPLMLIFTARREAADAPYAAIADDVRMLFERALKQGTMPKS